jgi:hypothetical protein
MDKYPVFSKVIPKNQTTYQSVDEIIEYLKALIEKHPIATYISIFEHYKHTECLEGSLILDGLVEAKNIIFCFGKQIPNTQILAVRPRSISVSELNDTFCVDFLEVPNTELHALVEKWVDALINKDA